MRPTTRGQGSARTAGAPESVHLTAADTLVHQLPLPIANARKVPMRGLIKVVATMTLVVVALCLGSWTVAGEKVTLRPAPTKEVAQLETGEKVLIVLRGPVIVFHIDSGVRTVEDGPEGWPLPIATNPEPGGQQPNACYNNRDDCVARMTQACSGQFDGQDHGGWSEIRFSEADGCSATCADGAEASCQQDG